MAGRIGDKIMSRQITLLDDGSDSGGMAVPFDYEGIPKQQVALIHQGRANEIVYDSHYAKLHRRHSTGHALAYDEYEGPLASNLFLLPESTPTKELLSRMEKGLWICRFHYVSGLLKTQEALMTGLTRDGTFLVRKGKVAGAVKNLRFTQSILEAFSKVVAVSQERRLVADPGQGFSATVCPALLIKDFTFTGQTK
jgi:predicted Zn-dependent protease